MTFAEKFFCLQSDGSLCVRHKHTHMIAEWLFGVLLTILAAILSTLGKVFIKFADDNFANDPCFVQEGVTRKRCGISCTGKPPKWLESVGWLLNCIIAPALDTTAFAFADQSILAPLCSLSIISNMFFSWLVLYEEITALKIVGTVGIAGSAATIVLIGNHKERHYTSPEIISLFKTDRFHIYFGALIIVMATLSLLYTKYKKPSSAPTHTIKEIMVVCAVAGLISGNLYVLKSFTEFARHAVLKAHVHQVHVPLLITLQLMTGSILIGMMAVKQLKEALCMRNVNATVVGPLYEGAVIVVGTLSGASFFGEWDTYGTMQIGVFLAALVVMLGSIAIVVREARVSSPPCTNVVH